MFWARGTSGIPVNLRALSKTSTSICWIPGMPAKTRPCPQGARGGGRDGGCDLWVEQCWWGRFGLTFPWKPSPSSDSEDKIVCTLGLGVAFALGLGDSQKTGRGHNVQGWWNKFEYQLAVTRGVWENDGFLASRVCVFYSGNSSWKIMMCSINVYQVAST